MWNTYFYVEKYFIDDERYNVLHCGVRSIYTEPISSILDITSLVDF